MFAPSGGASLALASVGVNVKARGAIGDGIADDTAVLQAAFSLGKPVYIPAGTYRITAPLVASGSAVSVAGDGRQSVIDASALTESALAVAGELSAVPDLASAASGKTVVLTDASSAEEGDWLCLHNPTDSSFSGFRTNYRAGEFARVLSKDNDALTTVSPLAAAYAAADVDVYRLDGLSVSLRGFSVLGGVSVSVASRVRIEDVHISGALQSTLSIVRAVDVVVRDCTIFNEGVGEGLDYGISIQNSQHVLVHGCDVYGLRHSIATGGDSQAGAVPVRDVRVVNCVLRSGTNDLYCADFHGNTTDSYYEGCTIYGGASLQGRDNGLINCTVHGMLASPFSVVYAAEILGGTHTVAGCRLRAYGDPQPATRGVIDFGGNTAVITDDTGDVTIIVRGNTLDSVALGSLTSFLLVANRGSTSKVNVVCDDNVLLVNDLANIARVRLISGTAAKDFVTASGNLANVSATELNADVGYA